MIRERVWGSHHWTANTHSFGFSAWKKSVGFICCHLWNMQLGGTFPAVFRMFYILASVLQNPFWVAKQNPAQEHCYSYQQHRKTVFICSFMFDVLLKVQPITFVSMQKNKTPMCSSRDQGEILNERKLYSVSHYLQPSLHPIWSTKRKLFRHIYSRFKWLLILLWNVLR